MVKNTRIKREFPRHIARKCAFQAIYAHMVKGESDPEELIQIVLKYEELASKVPVDFLRKLIISAIDRRSLADKFIQNVAENWELERISVVDRNILQLGIAEFMDFEETSPAVIIDEALELSKEFGSADSSRFINGILDTVFRKLVEEGLTIRSLE